MSAQASLKPPSLIPATTRILHTSQHLHHADAIFKRYQQRFIGNDIVRAILRLKQQSLGAKLDFSEQRKQWTNNGGYIESISINDVRTWINSKQYIVAEASDSNKEYFEPVADCIFRLADNTRVFPHLHKERDKIFNHKAYKAIDSAPPNASAIIDYLSSTPTQTGGQYAGNARYAATQEIIRQNTHLPPQARIRYSVGLSFAVQGLHICSPKQQKQLGEQIMLADLEESEIVNQASMNAISGSRRCPSILVGKWLQAPIVPISVDGYRYGLYVHWYCHIRQINTP